MPTDAYIALGSNVGDRELNLLRAVSELGRLPGCRVTGLSGFYETSPVGLPGQQNFYNAVLRLETTCTPADLLQQLLDIETRIFNRTRGAQRTSRRMDLDLLLFGQSVIEEEGLAVPHPRMTERRFVLQPLCDIASGLVHPVTGKSYAEHLSSLNTSETVKKI